MKLDPWTAAVILLSLAIGVAWGLAGCGSVNGLTVDGAAGQGGGGRGGAGGDVVDASAGAGGTAAAAGGTTGQAGAAGAMAGSSGAAGTTGAAGTGAGGCTPAVVDGVTCNCGGTCAPCPAKSGTACPVNSTTNPRGVRRSGCTLNGAAYVGCTSCSPASACTDSQGPISELYCASLCN